MTDIVERLRDRAKSARLEHTGTADGDAIHFAEAATEIERLRFELTAARNEIGIADGEIERLRAAVSTGKVT